MLFSAMMFGFKCTKCGSEYHEVAPTSLLPLLTVAICGGFAWYRLLEPLNWGRVWTFWAALLVAFLIPFLLFYLFDIANKIRLRKCEKCGGKLERTYSGFYDGMVPHPFELLVYVISIATPYTLMKFF